eukprot:CAMPEP_0206533680 /NCGR_PEP_ID=MMETSP0325_2-20121206/5103_1 /ASSEMBLY_ACC=CAM_ASM_000347 /TAXON_ID=2866 /ORGANISM="Crypthecodinium cohnii, Strain Seligo" /LENGTH=882 /DNA_ID=CAMNT_0054030357 /DNA_START=159 /DNA_END=2807 /DNA_ORIENTATION=+
MGGMYSWGAWIYSYNREAWMNDVQVRQNHDFQRDNMQIAAHDMSRGEIRDRTQAAITKLSNYILVTTLVLSLGAEMLVEGQVPDDCPDFVLNVYMLCLGSSMFYLIMSILFGVAASQELFENYVALLTDKVPPPWENIDSDMHKRETQNLTRAFEERPWQEIFMPPLLQSGRLRQHVKSVKSRFTASFFRCWRPQNNQKRPHLGSVAYHSASTGVISTTDGAVLPKSRRPQQQQTQQQQHCLSESPLWQQPRRPSVSEMLHLEEGDGGGASSSRGKGRGGGGGAGGNRGGGELAGIETGALGGLVPGAAAKGKDEPTGGSSMFSWLVPEAPKAMPAAPLSPVSALRAADSPRRRRSSSMLLDQSPQTNPLTWIEHSYDARWEQQETAWLPLQTHSGVCAASGLRNLLQAYAYLCMANLYGNNGSAWTFWAVQFIFVSLNVLTTQFLCQRLPRVRLFMMAAGPLSCAVAATTPWLLWDRILVPVCYFCHLSLALLEGCEEEKDHTTPLQDQGMGQRFEAEMEDNHYAGGSPASEFLHRAMSGSTAAFKNAFASESPTTTMKRGEQKRVYVHRLMRGGAATVQALWFFSAIWSLYVSALHPGNFKNSKAVLSFASRPPVAGLTTLKTSWSIYFRPHAMVCPESQIFLADAFRVYEILPKTQMVQPYPCSVNHTIADVTAVCEHGHCWPIVLVDSDPPTVVDCYSGWTKPLHQTQGRAFRMAAQGGRDIFVQSAHHVVQYEWMELSQSWSPVWEVAKLVDNPQMQHLTALDVVDDRLLMFGRGAVEVQDLDSGDSCGVWQLPPEVKGAGCAIEGGTAVLLLGQKDRMVFEGTVGGIGPKMELLCADLPTPRGTPCGDDMVHATKRGAQAGYTCQELLKRHLWEKA